MWESVELPDISATDIGLSFENGFLIIPPLDICVTFMNEDDLALEAYDGFTSRGSISVYLAKYSQETRLIGSVYLEHGKVSCVHVPPCRLLESLRDRNVKIAELPKAAISLSYKLEFSIRRPKIEDGIVPDIEKPYLEFIISGSSIQLSNKASTQFDETFIGSIAAIRPDSTCDARNCKLTIGGKEPISHYLEYSKGSKYLPSCKLQFELGSSLAGQLDRHIHSYATIDYFRIGNNGKQPKEIKYKVVSTFSGNALSSSTSLKRSSLIVIYYYCFLGISFVLALFSCC